MHTRTPIPTHTHTQTHTFVCVCTNTKTRVCVLHQGKHEIFMVKSLPINVKQMLYRGKKTRAPRSAREACYTYQ